MIELKARFCTLEHTARDC
uniref:Glutathione S-transferase TCHQD-like n=1 Tax=Rhizophora mucronata TaxID=61149 RepID=A0A2P2R455_RHIMU